MCWNDVVARFEERASADQPCIAVQSYARSMAIFAKAAEKMGIPPDKAEQASIAKLEVILPEGVRAAKRGCKQSMIDLLELAFTLNYKDLKLFLGSCNLETIRDVKVGNKHLIELNDSQFEYFKKTFRTKFAIQVA